MKLSELSNYKAAKAATYGITLSCLNRKFRRLSIKDHTFKDISLYNRTNDIAPLNIYYQSRINKRLQVLSYNNKNCYPYSYY